MEEKDVKDIETLISKRNHKNWGIEFDSTGKIPFEYKGKTFEEIDHGDIVKFFNMSNVEKFKMAYWIERSQSKRSGIFGFFLGVITIIFLEMILVNIFS